MVIYFLSKILENSVAVQIYSYLLIYLNDFSLDFYATSQCRDSPGQNHKIFSNGGLLWVLAILVLLDLGSVCDTVICLQLP